MLHSLNHYREYFNRVQYTSMYNNYTLGAILGAIYREVFKYILIIQQYSLIKFIPGGERFS